MAALHLQPAGSSELEEKLPKTPFQALRYHVGFQSMPLLPASYKLGAGDAHRNITTIAPHTAGLLSAIESSVQI